MSDHDTPPAGREPLDSAAADAVRAYAAKKRADADQLASILEDIAAHGLPPAITPWEDLRETKLAELAARRDNAA
ncbi:hypothetical protein ACXZ65_38015 [Streptomyces aculeolatus]